MSRFRNYLQVINRIAYIFSAALLIAGTALNFSTPPKAVYACYLIIAGNHVCQEDGSRLVTWRIGNSEISNPMIITSINRNLSGINIGSEITGSGSVTGTEILPGTLTGTITLGIGGKWASENSSYDTGSITIESACPQPTETTPTQPTPTDPTPTDPTPTEATPTEPTPTDATPTEVTPTEVTPTQPTPTDATPTQPTTTETNEPGLNLHILDPYCVKESGDWWMQWAVSNPNDVPMLIDYWSLDGIGQPGTLLAQPGKTKLVLTSLGTHTVEIYWMGDGYTSLEWTINSCAKPKVTPSVEQTAPAQIPTPVATLNIPISGKGEQQLIPVTGLFPFSKPQTFTFSGLALLGLSIVLSVIRKNLQN